MADKDKYYKDAASKDAKAKNILSSSRITSQDQRDKLSSILAGRTKAFEERRKKSEEDDAARKARLKQDEKSLDPYESAEAQLDEPSPFDAADARDRLDKKREIASELKDLSKRGALTGDLLKDARQKATDAGVSEDQFNTFLEGNRIRERGSAFSFKKPEPETGTGLFDQPATDLASSPEEARANVIFQRKFGTGLGALKAMQDPSYKVGSGSSLLDPTERKESEAGRLSRIGRGVGGPVGKQLQQVSAIARLTQPSIMTKDIKKQDVLSRKEAAKAAMLADAAAERTRKEEEERKKKEGAESGLPKSAESYELPKLTKAYSGVGKGSKNNSLRQS
jgi:hypothetical protein